MTFFLRITLFLLCSVLVACGGSSSGDTSTTPTVSPPATAPTAITLNVGTSNAVSGVTNVAIPSAGGTDRTGAVSGWIASTNNTIKFTVIDASTATSSITIDGIQYISGSDYVITSARTFTIVVTTSQTSSNTVTRTFSIGVTASGDAKTPSAITLNVGTPNPVGSVTNVSIPAAGGTDTTGAVTGWIASTNSNIKFNLTDVSPASSTITINGSNYVNGSFYNITAASPLTIIVTTTQSGAISVIRTFIVSVAAANYAAAPSAIVLAAGSSNAVAGVTNVAIPNQGGTDVTGAVTGWVASSNSRIKFTVTDTAPATSAITINGSSYVSGTDYSIGAATPLTVLVSTTQSGRLTTVRTFTVTVASATLTNPTITAISNVTINSSDYSGLCFANTLQECLDEGLQSPLLIQFPVSSSPGVFTSFSSSNSAVIPSIMGSGAIVGYDFSNQYGPFDPINRQWPQLVTIITLNQAATAYYNPGSTSFTLTINPIDRAYSPDRSIVANCKNGGVTMNFGGYKGGAGGYKCLCGPPYNDLTSSNYLGGCATLGVPGDPTYATQEASP